MISNYLEENAFHCRVNCAMAFAQLDIKGHKKSKEGWNVLIGTRDVPSLYLDTVKAGSQL